MAFRYMRNIWAFCKISSPHVFIRARTVTTNHCKLPNCAVPLPKAGKHWICNERVGLISKVNVHVSNTYSFYKHAQAVNNRTETCDHERILISMGTRIENRDHVNTTNSNDQTFCIYTIQLTYITRAIV